MVSADVMYLNCEVSLFAERTPKGRVGSECNERALVTMRAAAATGQSWGLTVSQKKGIFSPLCLFFCVHQRI